MKLLLLADEEDKMLWEHLDPRKLEGIDMILSCGDLKASYLSFLTCFTHAPIVYVHGNHDTTYETKPPEGCICADGDLVVVNGIRILGLGGSMRYKPGAHQYTEREMEKRIQKLQRKLWYHQGFDVLLTHAPMRGLGDMDDLPHMGFSCFEPLLRTHHPQLFAFAHVHATYGGSHFKREYEFEGIRCVNAWKSYVVEIDETKAQPSRAPLWDKLNSSVREFFHRLPVNPDK